ncbi:MAG: hypothetical protein LAN62_08975 [Acidobacteriia bacterium]|nr:hypothetical protein [Terriglobia bacterium]
MTSDKQAQKNGIAFSALSKRGARRAIQRAFVLVGRERAIRQHLREAELTTLWVIEDWDLKWTVVINHGRLEFHRGQVGKAQVSYCWQTGEGFLGQIATGTAPKDEFQLVSDPVWRRMVDPVFDAFASALRTVFSNPVDDDGERLL